MNEDAMILGYLDVMLFFLDHSEEQMLDGFVDGFLFFIGLHDQLTLDGLADRTEFYIKEHWTEVENGHVEMDEDKDYRKGYLQGFREAYELYVFLSDKKVILF